MSNFNAVPIEDQPGENLTRISRDFRAGGLQYGTIGYSYDTGEWIVFEGQLTSDFAREIDPNETVTRFATDREASAYSSANGYR